VVDFISDSSVRQRISRPGVNAGHPGYQIKRAAEKIVQTLRDMPDGLDEISVRRVLDDLLVELVPENVLALLDKPLKSELGIELDLGQPRGDAGVELGSYLVARKAVADVREAIEQVAARIQGDDVTRTAPAELKPIESVEAARGLAGDVSRQLQDAGESEPAGTANRILDDVVGDTRGLSDYDVDSMA